MASAGTKVGTGYVAIEPDFSGFQDAVERAIARRFPAVGDKAGQGLSDGIRKRIARDRDGFGLAPALGRLKTMLGKVGDDAGKVLADRIGKGAGQAKGDMFGLAGVLGEVQKRAASASRSAKIFEGDMLGVSRAADAAGKNLRSSRSQLRDWAAGAGQSSRAARGLGDRLRGLIGDLRNVRAGARTAAGGFGGINGAMARANRTAQFFRNVIRLLRFPAIVTGVGLLTQGLSALAAGFTAAASAAGPLAGVLVAMPALAATAAQAFGALKLATAGVGDTIKAALDAQVKGGGQAVDTLRQQRDATDRVADAERAYEDAQRQTKTTRDAVNTALRQARRDYRHLEAAAARSYLSEEEGALRVKELRQELDRVVGDADSSELDIRLAENALSQAKLDLREVRTEAKRTRKDYADATRAGVDNMPEVVSARQAHQDAIRGEQEAARDLKRAVEDSTVAMAGQGAAATKLAEEMGQLPPAAQAFVRQIVAMKPRLDQLRATAAAGLFPGVTTGLQALMGNFGVVNQLVASTSSAFGGLAANAGRALGGQEWGRDLALVGGQNVRTINQLGDAGGNLADTFRHLLVSARPFINWLGNGTVALTDWIEKEAEAGRETGRLAAFFDRTKKSMQLLGPILKGTAGSLLNIGKAARPLGNGILAALGKSAEGFRKWTASTEGQNSLRKYFTDAKPAIFEMGRLLRDVTKAFFTLGNQPGAAPLIKQVRTELLPALTDTVGTLTKFFGPALVGALTSGVQLLQSLSHESGPLVVLTKALGGLANALRWMVEHVPGVKQLVVGLLALKALSFAASITGVTKLSRAVLAAAGAHRSLAAGQTLVATMTKRGIVAALAAKVAMFASAAAAKAWTVAQWALNVAMRANPLGLVVTALTAVGAGLVLAYQKSETFRNIVNGALNAVKTAALTFADKWLGMVTTVLGGISSLATAAAKLPFGVGKKFEGVAGSIDKLRTRIDGWREDMRAGNRDGQNTRGLKAQQDEVDRLRTKLHGLKKGTREYKDTAETLRKKLRELNAALADARPAAGRAGRGLGVLRGNAAGLGGALGEVADYTVAEFNTVLKDFGAKKLIHKVKKFPKLQSMTPSLVPLDQLQQGGTLELAKGSIVPGSGTGDKVPLHVGGRLAAMVEPGELVSVANRKATAALMGVNEAVPRFQRGGIVELLHPFNDPAGHGGSNSHLHIAMGNIRALVNLGRRLQKLGWLVGEHPAFGGIQGRHAAGGYHYSNQAIDVNWPDPSQEAAKIRALLPTLDSGSLGGTEIGKLKVTGGTDATRAAVRGAAARLRDAANAKLAEMLGGIEGAETSLVTGDGDVEAVFAKVAKRLSRSKIATLALGMAGYTESDMEDLPYGDADSEGALQVRPSQHPGVDPHNEGQIASLFLTRGFTGRGGANALAAQGLPAHLVAQGVQGSFDSTGSNYLAQEGRARAWMKRFGLQKGGLVRMVGDSLGVGTLGAGLRSKIKGLNADARIGRFAAGSEGLFSKGFKQYIFDLGTNDTSPGAPAAVLRAVDNLTGDAPIHALTLNGPHAAEKNALLRGVGGDVKLIPWAAQSRGLLEPDGYHATSAGYGRRASLIASRVSATADALKAATNAKKRKGSTKRGGIGSPLGEIDISQATGRFNFSQSIHQTLKRVRRRQSIKGSRGRQLDRLMERIKASYALDDWPGEEPPGLAKRLSEYDANDELWADRALRADALTVDLEDASGEPVLDKDNRQVVQLGRMEGLTAAEWTQRRLDGLIRWRNDLIEARVRVREMLDALRKQIKRMQDKAKALSEKIAKLLTIKTKLGDLVAAKRLPRRPEGRIRSLSRWLAPKLREPLRDGRITARVLAEESRDRTSDRLNKIVALRGADVRERRAIVRRVIPALAKRETALTGDQGSYEEGLGNVQGPGGGRERADKFWGQPALGQFSGLIFDVGDELKNLNTPPPIVARDTGGSGDSERTEFLERELLLERQRSLLKDSQFKTLRDFHLGDRIPFAGTFHEGGVVPGPKGAERIALVQAGETILPDDIRPVAAVSSEPAPAPQVNVHVAPGMEWLRQFIRVEVVKESRKTTGGARRALAGTGRGV